MALTRAQLLMGDSSQGAVLTGQVQAVKAGAGITIGTDGTISVNSQTVIGLMKLGQTPALAAGAYNSYNWPSGTGTPGQQLTIDTVVGGATNLKWDDPDQIPWTALGQLVVGTGINTQTILNPGTTKQVLVVDPVAFPATGIGYTSNYVDTTGATGAANIPAGTAAQKPASPAIGAFRLNTSNTSLEFYNGAAWETVASSSVNGFVEQTSATGAAILPAGVQAARPGSPVAGYFRFNDTNDLLEFYNGTSWQTVASSATGLFVEKTSLVGSALIPVGTTAQQPSAATYPGSIRFNDDTDGIEFSNGTSWLALMSMSPYNAYNKYNWPTTTGTPGQQLTIQTVGGTTQLAWGDPDQIPWTALGQLVVGTGVNTQTLLNPGTTGQILVADAATFPTTGVGYTSNYVATKGSTTAAIIPAGTTGQQPAAPTAGNLRWNTTNNALEVYDASVPAWESIPSSSTTGFVPQTSALGAAILPTGATGNRPAGPAQGYFRFNTTTDELEVWDGLIWATVPSSASGAFVAQSVPTGPAGATANAIIPGGTTAQRQVTPALSVGEFRFNTDLDTMEFYDGANWISLLPLNSTTSVGLGLTVSGANNEIIKLAVTNSSVSPAAGTGINQAVNGSIYFDNEYGSFFYRYADGTSTQWVQVTGTNIDGGLLNFPTGPNPGDTFLGGNGITYTYDSVKDVWTAQSSGFPDLGLNYNASSGLVKTSIPINAVPSPVGTGPGQAIDGSTYWDREYGALFIRYTDGNGTSQWVENAVSNVYSGPLDFPPTPTPGQQYIGLNGITYTYNNTKGVWTAQPVQPPAPATLAEAAAGIITTAYSSPETAVPKDAAGMTGAALIPTGDTGQRPGAPVNGMLRFNTDQNAMEAYNAVSSTWKEIAYVGNINPLPPNQAWGGAWTAAGVYSVNNLTIADGTVVTPSGSGTFIFAYGDVTIGNSVLFQYGAVGVTGTGAFKSASDAITGLPGLGGAPGTPDSSPSGTVPWISYNPGSGGAGAKATTTNARNTQQGGSAGGIIAIYCLGNVTIGSGCIFNAFGGNVTTTAGGTYAGGGAGGGAGGSIVIQAAGNLTIGGSAFNVFGGNGGNGINSSGHGPASGGGGGGGGYVILGAAGTFSDASSKNLNGGAGGSAVGGGGTRGSGGGGNAGRGGSATATNGQPGSPGIYQYMLTF